MMKVERHDPSSSHRGTTMDLTDRARRDLGRYLERVRDSLGDRGGVDPEEVVAGIREHVEATLASHVGGPVTAEELADVLERLGSPEEWGEDETVSRIATPPDQVTGGAPGTGPWIELVPLILAAAGGTLILVELTVPLGWGLLAVAAVTARLVAGSAASGLRRPSVSGTLVAVFWHLSAMAAVTGILLAPAVLVWGQSQIGGALVPFLLEHTLPPGASATTIPGTRPTGYWPLTGLVAGTVTGAWWVAVGVAWRAASEKLRRALGPADHLASPAVSRTILVTGGFLFVVSLVLLVGALG